MSIEHTYGYDLAMPFLGVEVPAHALFGLAAGRGSGGNLRHGAAAEVQHPGSGLASTVFVILS